MGGLVVLLLFFWLLVLFVLVWISNKLFVLFSFLVNLLKFRCLVFELDCCFFVWFCCRGGGEFGLRLDSEFLFSVVEGEEVMMVVSCGWECVF